MDIFTKKANLLLHKYKSSCIIGIALRNIQKIVKADSFKTIKYTKIILLWQVPNVLPKGSCFGGTGA